MMHNLVITRRLVKNEYQNFMCYNEIELHAQNIDTNLDSVVNMIGRAYVIQLRRKRIFTLTSYTNLHLVKLRFQTCTIFVVHNCLLNGMIPNMIQQPIGPNALPSFFVQILVVGCNKHRDRKGELQQKRSPVCP